MIEPYRTKAQLAFSALKRIIDNGELPPGVPVSQRALAQRLGMSLTPVREAVRRLEAEGLVSGLPHTTLRVRDVNPDEVHDIYGVRTILEGSAARIAASRLGDDDVIRLADYLKKMTAALRRGELRTYSSLDEAFHMFIYGRAANLLLVELIKDLWHRYPRDAFWAIRGRAERSIKDHRRIFEALRKRDETAAERLMISHIASSMDDILRYVDRHRESSKPEAGGRPLAARRRHRK